MKEEFLIVDLYPKYKKNQIKHDKKFDIIGSLFQHLFVALVQVKVQLNFYQMVLFCH